MRASRLIRLCNDQTLRALDEKRRDESSAKRILDRSGEEERERKRQSYETEAAREAARLLERFLYG